MSFIAAMLLLNMDTVDAFICFSNLMHKPCQMAFFTVNQPVVSCIPEIVLLFSFLLFSRRIFRVTISSNEMKFIYYCYVTLDLRVHLRSAPTNI